MSIKTEKRSIIKIDESKCDGCGLCVTACAEGAIGIVDGKARLISESYCDGLGACLGECPQGAITIEMRDAMPFDEQAVHNHKQAVSEPLPCGCPGSHARAVSRPKSPDKEQPTAEIKSRLANWPVQLALVPKTAPYLKGASLVISADCVPFAYADFHRKFLGDKIVLVGCPKLDDAGFYKDKLADIIRTNDIHSIEVLYMEVPCCGGLARLVGAAVAESGSDLPVNLVKVGIDGDIMDRTRIGSAK